MSDIDSDVPVIIELRAVPLVDSQGAAAASAAGLAAAIDQLECALRAMADPGDSARIIVGHRYARLLVGISARLPRHMIPEVQRLSQVRHVHPDRPVRAALEHGVIEVGAPDVWQRYSTRGRGVVVAVIDTGVDYTHPTLGGGIGPGFKVVGGHDFSNNDDDPMDDNGHGTHVAAIVAGDGGGLVGVAPDASILAYKVLDSTGGGSDSDVIAALEWAVDPNRDGDTADHAQVINLSLGGRGDPDDAPSRAVDKAVEAGAVVCVSAGNDNWYLYVSSPATARRAIAVGASDGTKVAEFSSGGPTQKVGLIKPNVVAPGVAVRSAVPGGTATWNGTSMACPHVSGVAALLRAVYPGWSPAQVASAIVSTATDLGLPIMRQGAGKVSAPAAATTMLFSDPATVSFGVDLADNGPWSSSRTLHVSTSATTPTAVAIGVGGVPPGVSLTWSPQSLDLPPAGSQDLTLTLVVDGSRLPPTPESLSFGGLLTLTTGGHSIRLPWAFAKCARVRAQGAGSYHAWGLKHGFSTGLFGEPDWLLPEGRCVLLGVGSKITETGRATFAVLKEIDARGDMTVTLGQDAAIHRVVMPEGATPAGGEQMAGFHCRPSERFSQISLFQVFKPGVGLVPIREYWVSDVPPSVPLTFLDWRAAGSEPDRAFVLAEYPQPEGIHGDLLLATPSLDPYTARLEIPQARSKATAEVGFGVNSTYWRLATLLGFSLQEPSLPFTFWLTSHDQPTSQDLFVGAVLDSELRGRFMFGAPLRIVQHRLGLFRGMTPEPGIPWTSPGEGVNLGGGLQRVTAGWNGTRQDRTLAFDIEGPLGESRADYRSILAVKVERPGGTTVEGATFEVDPWGQPLVHLPPTLAEPVVVKVAGQYPRARRDDARIQLDLDLDLGLERCAVPSLTSLLLIDEWGKHVTSVPARGSHVKLHFSVVGCAERQDCSPAGLDTLKVSVRPAGRTSWTALPTEIGLEDAGTWVELGHDPLGRVVEAWVPPEMLGQPGWVDVQIAFANAQGNKATWTLEPGFEVTAPPPPRRRLNRSH